MQLYKYNIMIMHIARNDKSQNSTLYYWQGARDEPFPYYMWRKNDNIYLEYEYIHEEKINLETIVKKE